MMGELGPDGFSDFFRALNGNQYDPFPWQMRLAERVIDGEWPSVIALPTSSGKTACIDIAVYALACQADLPVVKRTAPRRIFFVIDRRVVVDEAYERAKGIAHRLLEAKNGIIRTVADKLRHLACGDEPLACFQLRGGIYRDDSWARTPVQPSVIASTVDQIGSRILFRGYGLRSGYMWPIHAGLAGNDSLIILDEAHCAVPFKETMEAVYKYRKWALEPLKNPFAFVMMTATPPSEIEEADIFSADSFDQEHIVLGKRLDSKKPTKLVVAKNAKGDDALKHLAHELAEQALGLVQDGRPTAVGIIANRVSIAKMVHDELSQRSSGDVVLLIGGMRGLDRDKVVGKWLGKLNATEAATRQLNRPVFVVATQCLEVGANFDFDFLVSECASLDALRQRFGRLNRTGRDIRAAGVIVIRADQVAPKIEDPIYGQALAATWKWLCDHSGNSQIDMGINSLSEVFNAELAEQPNLIDSLQQPARHAPVMLPTYVDFFAQTAPAPAIDPDPSLFLHGIKNSRPEVQVVWRSDIDPESDDLEAWVEAVSLCPPTSGEYMLVPISTLRNWFKFRDNPSLSTDNDLSDVMAEQPDSRSDSDLDATFHLLRWNGPQQSEFITSPANIRPGDTIIIPSKMGGWDFMGHIPPEHAKTETVDRGDEAHINPR
jgi:CRISPR-associated endonuclease/helicase Cas3